MTRSVSSTSCFLGAILAALSNGCAKPSDAVPVEGHVSYKGEAIANGALMFFPERGRATLTNTDASGDYSLDLPPGQYTVIVNVGVKLPPGWKESDPIPPQKTVLPPDYTTRARSSLRAKVDKGLQEPIDFGLK